jgi:hypothetical protein
MRSRNLALASTTVVNATLAIAAREKVIARGGPGESFDRRACSTTPQGGQHGEAAVAPDRRTALHRATACTMSQFEGIDNAGVCELAHLLLGRSSFERKTPNVPLLRSTAVCAALAAASLTCGGATAAGARSGTLSVTVQVVNSAPTVRLVDAQGKSVKHAEAAAAVNTKTEKSVLYLVVEY